MSETTLVVIGISIFALAAVLQFKKLPEPVVVLVAAVVGLWLRQ